MLRRVGVEQAQNQAKEYERSKLNLKSLGAMWERSKLKSNLLPIPEQNSAFLA